MSKDYIPRPDAEFNNWQDKFVSQLRASPEAFGLKDSDLEPLLHAQTEWQASYKASLASKAALEAANMAKDNARSAFERPARAFTQQIQKRTVTTDTQRATLGISTPKQTRTAASVPTTRPIARVDTSERLTHLIYFSDEQTPTSKARPDGVIGCEIWNKVGGAAPADQKELAFAFMDTQAPHRITYTGADAGQIAHYMLRWINTKGEAGPWSRTVSATIAA
ncbi:MAG TPA: hypothetical protein VGC91_03900 [Pyrinomonadaceae bacterium]|jgi:hypothetical protein